MVSYNFVIHAICSLALALYKSNELQMSYVTQKLNCKANYKTPFFFIVNIFLNFFDNNGKNQCIGFLNESKNNVVYVK